MMCVMAQARLGLMHTDLAPWLWMYNFSLKIVSILLAHDSILRISVGITFSKGGNFIGDDAEYEFV